VEENGPSEDERSGDEGRRGMSKDRERERKRRQRLDVPFRSG